MNEYTLWDGEAPVKFTGTRLAAHSSYTPSKDRWTETEIYRTRGGSYVLHKIGQSRLPDETTRYSVQVSETPHGLIESLRFLDDDGVLTMRHVDKMALIKACEQDDILHAAFAEGITIA